MIQVLALDDHFAVGRVEGLQHHAVAALDIALQGALALIAVDQHAKVAVFQCVLLVHKGKVAVLNAGLHAVAAHHQIKIVGGVLHTGILLTVVLLKGEGTVTGLYRADHRDQAFRIAAKEPLFRGGNIAYRAVQAQQIICCGVQKLGNAGHGRRIGRGLAAFPFADSLLCHAQFGSQLSLADALLFAALLQKF